MFNLLQLIIFIPILIGFTISSLVTRNNSFEKENEVKPFWQPPGYMFSIVWSILYLLNGYALYYVLSTYKNIPHKQLYIILSLFILQLTLENSWVIYSANLLKSNFNQLLILFVLVFTILTRILHFASLQMVFVSLLISLEIIWLIIAISLQAYNLKVC